MLLAMAWRNLWRHRVRTLLTSLALSMAMVLVMWLMALYAGMFGTMRTILIDRGIGHAQIQHEAFPTRRGMYDTIEQADRLMAAIDALELSEGSVARLYGEALLGTEETSTGVQLVGIEPARERSVTRLHESVLTGGADGETPFLGEEPALEILLGKGLAKELEIDLTGAEPPVVTSFTQTSTGAPNGDAYTVIGIIETGNPTLDRAGAFLHIRDLQDLIDLPDQVHELRVLTDSEVPERVDALTAALDDAVAAHRAALATDSDAEVAAYLSRPWWEIDPMAEQLFGFQGIAEGLMLVIVLGLAAIGVVNTMLMSVLERTRELGVMGAVGLKPRQIVLLVLYEAILIAGLACAIGLVLGLAAQAQIVFLGMTFAVAEGEGFTAGGFTLPPVIYGEFTLSAIVSPIVGALFFASIAALWPAIRAARLNPVDAIRSE